MKKTNPAPSAAPGTKEPKAKKEKVAKVKYTAPAGSAWVDDKGLLTRWPDDFDPKRHKGLDRKQFAEEHVFFSLQADRLEAAAVKMRERAEESKKLGNVKDRTRAKKLLAAQKRLEALKAEMISEGVDVDDLLASMAAVTE